MVPRGLIVATAVACLFFAAPVAASQPIFATAYVQGTNCRVVPGVVPNGTAFGSFNAAYSTTGWNQLEISTGGDAEASTMEQAFAVGCLESFFSHDIMYQFWQNYVNNNYGVAGPSAELLKFMSDQQTWLRTMIAQEAGSGQVYWQGMQHLMSQFDGLVAGYQMFAPADKPMSPMHIYMLNSAGDLEDLNGLFKSTSADQDVHNHDAGIPNKDKDLDCSGFIKILPNNADLVVGHSTWKDFYAMLRVYKIYNLAYAPSRTVSMSSSPGFLHSKDDFYATPNTVVLETTNSVFNTALYKHITTECALSWQRAAVSVQWATTGEQWTKLFAQYNSGTYNNQWMVVDAASFTPGKAPPTENLLWIIEQIPGTTQAADVTDVLLKQTYWASYNIPYFPAIYNISGYPAVAAKKGSPYVYEDCQRARIFRRNQTQVKTQEDAQMLMRYNNYEHDPLSLGDPVLGGVCARGDLQSNPVAFGCVDSKMTSATHMAQSVNAISGPTRVQQPTFVFDPKFDNVPHAGVNNVWDFDWVTIKPQLTA